MSKEEFMSRLMDELKGLNENDREQIQEYYGELIWDGLELGKTEESVVAGFGDPKAVADQIKADYKEFGQFSYDLPMRRTHQNYTSGKPIHTVIVDGENVRIQVRAVPSGHIRVLFDPVDSIDQVSLTEQNGEFIFRHRNRTGIFLGMFHMFHGKREITLELPSDYAGNLQVQTKNCPITVYGGLHELKNARIITRNGKISVEDLTCPSVLIQTSNSPLNLRRMLGDQLEAVTSNGHIQASDCRFSYGLILATQNSSIEGEDLGGDRIVLKTSNSSITGNIMGAMHEYSIESHTSNASNNLPGSCNPGRQKQLTVKTSNGRINLSFQK